MYPLLSSPLTHTSLTTALALARSGSRVVVVDAARGAPGTGGNTAANSRVIHAGLYYAPGSLKSRLCAEGRPALYRYLADRGLPHAKIGKLIVATDPSQHAQVGRPTDRPDDDERAN